MKLSTNHKYIIGGITISSLFLLFSKNSPAKYAESLLKKWKGVKETDVLFYNQLRTIWLNLGYSQAKSVSYINSQIPWSAAFVSFAMQKGGKANFPASASHTCFASKIKTGKHKGFKLKRISEYKPKVGDIVIRNRGGGRLTFNSFRCGDYSHSDIVVSKGSGKLFLIGGNLSNSIKKTYVRINSNGEITDRRYFAIVKVD